MASSYSFFLGSTMLIAVSLHCAALAETGTPKEKSATFLSWGNPGGGGGTLLSKGYNVVDTPQAIDCKNASGCTIEIDAMVGIGNDNTDAQWAICAFVDSAPVQSPPCWEQGYINNNFVTGNSRQNATITQGEHTVQTEVFVNNNAYLENWQSDYVLYSPAFK